VQIESIKGLAECIFEFETQFNDKIRTLVIPARIDDLVLTRSQFKVLVILLFEPGRTATELGDAMDMTKASLTGILVTLEAEGLATRTADPGDRRKVRLSLTEKGRSFCETKMREFEARLEARMAPLSDADLTKLAIHLTGAVKILKKLGE
jgi:MarR family transcriptional regulator, organic hydroperoxide resistance regulator